MTLPVSVAAQGSHMPIAEVRRSPATLEHARTAEENLKVFEFSIVHGKLGDEEKTIQVTEGDIVEFRWSSDEELSLHMHGYKIDVDVAPNSPATMRVNAIKTGRFPVLNHDGNPPNVLLYLEVLVPTE
jgi:hypothetical protein